MQQTISKIEARAIKLGVVANLVMAFSGWAAFNLSGSQALLLDGNMSFILFLTTLVALKINQVKSLRTEQYPFGLYVTEAMYTLTKGLLLLGVVISAIVSNSSKVLDYFNGVAIATIKTDIIVYYAPAMVTICWGLSAFYYWQNKRIGNKSSLLSVDQKSSFIDGILSAATGAILIVIGYVEPNSRFDFLRYIGDALLVLILAVMIIGQPIAIIKNAFVELVGGKLRDKGQYQDIETTVKRYFVGDEQKLMRLNISKTGSNYLVVIGLSLADLQSQNIANWQVNKQKCLNELSSRYPFVDMEVTVI
ncbi:cation transporter [Vibrio sinaloensis]|uniref:cation transporter n=1 Tax=Photobacterium sp. (strain ATCC 43367) TaxID=379097 RepID=UPI0020580150|nr:cation transporter [Vibrio sinaloensis]UPQ88866.1 cation transporter [Vibrio sinaloensis]